MTQPSPPIPIGLDPGIAAYLDALAGRTEASINANVDRRFEAFEARLKFVEGQVKPSGNPPPTTTPPAGHDDPIPAILMPDGASLNGSLSSPPSPASSPRPTLVHRQDALERKVDRLLKVHGVRPGDVVKVEGDAAGAFDGLSRALRWAASPEGRKQLGVLVAAIAAIYGAVHGTSSPAPGPPPTAPPSLPLPQGSG